MATAPRPTLLYLVIASLSWPVFKSVFRLRARGLENVPSRGGYVLAANHSSNFDPWALGVPLVPVGIKGTDRLAQLGPLRVAFGAPIPLDDLAGADPKDAADTATERLMAAIYELEASL